jgi:hypothetical protein
MTVSLLLGRASILLQRRVLRNCHVSAKPKGLCAENLGDLTSRKPISNTTVANSSYGTVLCVRKLGVHLFLIEKVDAAPGCEQQKH